MGGTMKQLTKTRVRDDADFPVGVARAVEELLHALASKNEPALWRRRGWIGVAVSAPDQLVGHVSNLDETGEWALLTDGDNRAWSQIMRLDGGWIVEVNGYGSDDFAHRVVGPAGNAGRRLRCRGSNGQIAAGYFDGELFDAPREVARLMWFWVQCGRLPEGCSLRRVQVGRD